MHEILIILALLVVNGVFAMSELAVLSSRRARLRQMADRGNRRARAALELAESPNRFLSTVQVGITMVGIFAGAYGEATLALPLAERIGRVPALAPYAQTLSLALVVAAITYVSLVLGELIPKRLALLAPERVAAFVARPMHLLSRLASPLVTLLTVSTDLSLRLFGIRPGKEASVTPDEIRGMIDEGARAGVFDKAEQDMMRNVMRLGERMARDVMTPRTEIAWLDAGDPPDVNRGKVASQPHNRYPVGLGSLDNLLGVIEAREFLVACAGAGCPDLRAAVKPALVVPDKMPAIELLVAFRDSGSSFALIADELGTIDGVVTAADVLASVFGDLGAALGTGDEPHAVRRADGSWLLSGMMPLDEMKETLNLDAVPGEAQGHFRTVAGFVLSQVGRLPQVGEVFDFRALRFEVVDMDGNRVDKVLVTPREADGDAPAPTGPPSRHPA